MKIILSSDHVAGMIAEHFAAKGQRVNRVLYLMDAMPKAFDPATETGTVSVAVTGVEITVDPLPKRVRRSKR